MADMMPYKIRLVKAMPEKIHREKDSMWDIARGWFDCDDESGEWKFWGPLADELKVSAYDVTDHPKNDPSDISPCKPTWLEAIAEAVCQEAERRAGPTP